MKILYYTGWTLTRIVSTIFFRIRVAGRHNLPQQGGFILATNHRSYFDPLLAGSWSRRQVYFMAKRELFQNRLLGWLITRTNALPVKRGTIDRNAIKLCCGVLESGYGLTIFPEGTRARGREFLPAKPGIGIIASEAGVPIVPAYIHGSDRLPDCLLGRDRLGIYYGKPIEPETIRSFTAEKEGYLALAEYVMDQIKGIKSSVIPLK